MSSHNLGWNHTTTSTSVKSSTLIYPKSAFNSNTKSHQLLLSSPKGSLTVQHLEKNIQPAQRAHRKKTAQCLLLNNQLCQSSSLQVSSRVSPRLILKPSWTFEGFSILMDKLRSNQLGVWLRQLQKFLKTTQPDLLQMTLQDLTKTKLHHRSRPGPWRVMDQQRVQLKQLLEAVQKSLQPTLQGETPRI